MLLQFIEYDLLTFFFSTAFVCLHCHCSVLFVLRSVMHAVLLAFFFFLRVLEFLGTHLSFSSFFFWGVSTRTLWVNTNGEKKKNKEKKQQQFKR